MGGKRFMPARDIHCKDYNSAKLETIHVSNNNVMSLFVPACETQLCASLPNSVFSDIVLVAQNWLKWKYLHHKNRQILQNRACFSPRKLEGKHESPYHWYLFEVLITCGDYGHKENHPGYNVNFFRSLIESYMCYVKMTCAYRTKKK